MNLQVMFGNPINGKKKKKGVKTMAKKKATKIRKSPKKTRKNPQDVYAVRGIHKVKEGRIATSGELANMKRTIADAKKNRAGKSRIALLESDYIAAKDGVKSVLGKRKSASHYGFSKKFKTAGVKEKATIDMKAVGKSIARKAKKKIKAAQINAKKAKKKIKSVFSAMEEAVKPIGGVVANKKKASKKKARKSKLPKKTKTALKPKKAKKKTSKKKGKKSKAKKAKVVAAVAAPKKAKKVRRKAKKKLAKKKSAKRVSKKKSSKKVSKKKVSKKKSKKKVSKKKTSKKAKKKTSKKRKSSKRTKKVKVQLTAAPKKAKKVRRKAKKAISKGKRKVSKKTSKKSMRNPIGGNMANKTVAKVDNFMNKNLGHKLSEAAGLFGGGAAISAIGHITNIPAVKAMTDKLDLIPVAGPVIKKNLDVLLPLIIGFAGYKYSKNKMVQEAAKGLIGASVVSIGSRSYNTGATAVGAVLPTSASTLNGIKAVPNFGAIKFNAPSFGAITKANEFGGVINRPQMYADALESSYSDSTYEMETESEF